MKTRSQQNMLDTDLISPFTESQPVTNASDSTSADITPQLQKKWQC